MHQRILSVLSLCVPFLLASGLLSGEACDELFVSQAMGYELPGWQGLRVIEQKGRPSLLRAADLNADGKDELIVVNSRSSRLDIYSSRNEKSTAEPVDAQRPNELPFAVDWEHKELQLEHVPRDVLVRDLDEDGRTELIILVSSPNQVVVYNHSQDGDWEKQYKIDLLDGDIASRRGAMLLRPTASKGLQLLVSMDNGIQQLTLKAGGQAKWLTPREERSRVEWWLADLDGDGRNDLVEQTREPKEAIRWYRNSETGDLTPASVLRDRTVKDVELIRTKQGAQLVVLADSSRGILRRYQLGLGAANPFGKQQPLALKEGKKTVWCSMLQGDKPTLVMADGTAPRFLCYGLDKNGWGKQQVYPALTDIKSLATMAGQPGSLLLWTKDAADLRISRWDSKRLTYPEPWPQSAEVEARKILALDSVGPITWWVQKVGKNLDLYLAEPGAKEPTQVRFEGVGAKAEQVQWLGGERLLVKETHGRALKLFTLKDKKAKVTSPTHLKKASLSDFKLFSAGDDVVLGRLTNGVLQWLGDDLRSKEQVMLPQGQQLSDYVVVSKTGGWALQAGTPFVHRIEIDDSRLSKSVERVKLGNGVGLVQDPVLGMLLLGHDRITQLSEGRESELKLVDAIDDRVGRSGGIRKTLFHRLSTLDINNDGSDDLVLYDELKHRLTVLGASAGALKTIISWPVFDDKKYPYSDELENLVKEPRAVLAADFDGDQQQDLALLCHDRLIIYLANEKP